MSITTAQIEALRNEAGTAGDMMQARVCEIALGTPYAEMPEEVLDTLTFPEMIEISLLTQEDALDECERVIADAQAQL